MFYSISRAVNTIKSNEPGLFTYLKAKNIHPHDYFLSRVLLRFLPEWVTPNKLTALRIVMTPFVFWLIVDGQYLFGVSLFLIAAFTDAMDGSLARTKNLVTHFGMLFDPLADKLLIGSMVLLIVFQYYPIWLGLTILAIEIIFIISALVAKIKFKTVHMANRWGKIKMILQVFAVFLTLLALLLNFPYLFTIAAWIFGLAIGFALLSLFFQGV